jgi:hypothetical protein
MKRVKLILPKGDGSLPLGLGLDATLVDADTGEPLEPVGDFQVTCPMDGPIKVHAEILISEVELQ